MYSFMLKTTHNPPTMNDKTHLKKKIRVQKLIGLRASGLWLLVQIHASLPCMYSFCNDMMTGDFLQDLCLFNTQLLKHRVLQHY